MPTTLSPTPQPDWSRSHAMSALLAENWWAIALRGVFAIVLGVLALAVPGAVMFTLATVFAAYLLVDGVFGIVAAVRAARHDERWGLLLLEGILNIPMGIVVFLFPLGAVFGFVVLTAAWALITGALMMWAAFRLRAGYGRIWMAISGLVSVVFGVLLAAAPLMGAVVLTWWLGVYAIAFGVALLVLSFSLRNQRGRHLPGTPTASRI